MALAGLSGDKSADRVLHCAGRSLLGAVHGEQGWVSVPPDMTRAYEVGATNVNLRIKTATYDPKIPQIAVPLSRGLDAFNVLVSFETSSDDFGFCKFLRHCASESKRNA